jgi:hypothetical protein
MDASGERVAVGAPLVEEAAAAPAPVLPVAGVLLDEHGRGVADARVELLPSVEPISGFEWSLSEDWSTRTGPTGAFVFEESDAADGGVLSFGFGLFLGGAVLTQDVDESGHEQVLRLPPPLDGPAVLITTVDERGAPVAPLIAELESLGGTPKGLYRAPKDLYRAPKGDSVRPHSKGVVVDPIPSGKWRLWLAGAGTSPRDVRFTVPPEGPDVELEVVLTRFDGARWSMDLDAAPGGRTWPDVEGGFSAWLPETRRELGEGGSNRHFGHTVTAHGTGEVRGALLELRLRATHDISTNDTVNLEFDGADGPRFAWHSRIAALPGVGDWRPGERATVRLDLSRLPGAAAVDLLPSLADGRLDVVVADDTIVEALRLFVLR